MKVLIMRVGFKILLLTLPITYVFLFLSFSLSSHIFFFFNMLVHTVAVVASIPFSYALTFEFDRFICRSLAHLVCVRCTQHCVSCCAVCRIAVMILIAFITSILWVSVYVWLDDRCAAAYDLACLAQTYVRWFIRFVRSLSLYAIRMVFVMFFFELVKNIKNVVLLLTNNALNQLLMAYGLYMCVPHTHSYVEEHMHKHIYFVILTRWFSRSLSIAFTRFLVSSFLSNLCEGTEKTTLG